MRHKVERLSKDSLWDFCLLSPEVLYLSGSNTLGWAGWVSSNGEFLFHSICDRWPVGIVLSVVTSSKLIVLSFFIKLNMASCLTPRPQD